ncbi:hypothetical protein INR49_026141, partial [Caranx melampygus]
MTTVLMKIMKQLLQSMNVDVFVGVTCPALFAVVLMVVVICDSVQETFGLLPPPPLTDCGADQARRHQGELEHECLIPWMRRTLLPVTMRSSVVFFLAVSFAMFGFGLSLLCHFCPGGTNDTCEAQQVCAQDENSCFKLTSGGPDNSQNEIRVEKTRMGKASYFREQSSLSLVVLVLLQLAVVVVVVVVVYLLVT